MRENYQLLSPGQREQIAVKETEIVFSHPYLIGMMMDEEASKINRSIPPIYLLFSFRISIRGNHHDISCIEKSRILSR